MRGYNAPTLAEAMAWMRSRESMSDYANSEDQMTSLLPAGRKASSIGFAAGAEVKRCNLVYDMKLRAVRPGWAGQE